MYTFQELLSEIGCEQEQLARIIRCGLIQPVTKNDTDMFYSAKTLESLKQDFEKYLEKCDEIEEQLQKGQEETMQMFKEMSQEEEKDEPEHSLEEDATEENTEEVSEEEEQEQEEIEEESELPDEIKIEIEEDEKSSKKKKNKKTRGQSIAGIPFPEEIVNAYSSSEHTISETFSDINTTSDNQDIKTNEIYDTSFKNEQTNISSYTEDEVINVSFPETSFYDKKTEQELPFPEINTVSESKEKTFSETEKTDMPFSETSFTYDKDSSNIQNEQLPFPEVDIYSSQKDYTSSESYYEQPIFDNIDNKFDKMNKSYGDDISGAAERSAMQKEIISYGNVVESPFIQKDVSLETMTQQSPEKTKFHSSQTISNPNILSGPLTNEYVEQLKKEMIFNVNEFLEDKSKFYGEEINSTASLSKTQKTILSTGNQERLKNFFGVKMTDNQIQDTFNRDDYTFYTLNPTSGQDIKNGLITPSPDHTGTALVCNGTQMAQQFQQYGRPIVPAWNQSRMLMSPKASSNFYVRGINKKFDVDHFKVGSLEYQKFSTTKIAINIPKKDIGVKKELHIHHADMKRLHITVRGADNIRCVQKADIGLIRTDKMSMKYIRQGYLRTRQMEQCGKQYVTTEREKREKMMASDLALLMQRFGMDIANVNKTDAIQGLSLTGKFFSPTTGFFKIKGTKIAAENMLLNFQDSYDLKSFAGLLYGNAERCYWISKNGRLKLENVSTFQNSVRKYFLQKYQFDIIKNNKKTIEGWKKTLKGADAELLNAFLDSKGIKDKYAYSLSQERRLKTRIRQNLTKLVSDTDAYGGFIMMYRGIMVTKSTAYVVLRAAKFTLKHPGKAVGKAVIRKASKNEQAARLINEVILWNKDREKAKVIKADIKKQKKADLRKKTGNAVKSKIRNNPLVQTMRQRWLVMVDRNRYLKKVFSSMKKVAGKGGFISGIIGKVGSLSRVISGLLTKAKIMVGVAIAVGILFYMLYNMIVTGIETASNAIASVVPNVILKVLGMDDFVESDTNESSRIMSEYIGNTANTLYKLNQMWYESLDDNAEKQTPKGVNGSTVYGGQIPSATGKSTKYAIKKFDNIFYHCFNGNGIKLNDKDKLEFDDTAFETEYDDSTNTKAILAAANTHFQCYTFDDAKWYKLFQSDQKSDFTDYCTTMFRRSHLVDYECSDVYQCGGCKTLNNYYCTNQELSDAKCKGPAINGKQTSYGFLTSDSKGEFNNHNGQGCVLFYCNEKEEKGYPYYVSNDAKDGTIKKYSESYPGFEKKVAKFNKYGCKSKDINISETALDDNFKKLNDCFYSGVWTREQITDKVKELKKAKKKDKKIIAINPLTIVDKYTLVRPDKSQKKVGKITYTLKGGKILFYSFNKEEGKVTASVSYEGGYCDGHYTCDGHHTKKYCPGHVDLDTNFAVASITTEEANDKKLFALDPWKEKGSAKNRVMDDNDAKEGEYEWTGWDDLANREYAYDIYNEDYDDLGFNFDNNLYEAGEYDEEAGMGYSLDGDTSFAEKAISFALSKVGYPYSQPLRNDGNHFDCSSLMYYAYKSAGISISYKGANTAAAEAQWAQANKCVVYDYKKKGDLNTEKKLLDVMQPGDLIFWNNSPDSNNERFYSIDHTGMYLGNKQIVAASSSKHQVVTQGWWGYDDIVMIARPCMKYGGSNSFYEVTKYKIGTEFSVPTKKELHNTACTSYMRYTAVTSKTSLQYKLLNWAGHASTNNKTGVRQIKCSTGETRICIAMGTYYIGTVGAKFDITFSNGTTIKAILGDIKSDAHTDKTHRYMAGGYDHGKYYGPDYSVVEYVVGDGDKFMNNKKDKKSYCANSFVTKVVYQGMETGFR